MKSQLSQQNKSKTGKNGEDLASKYLHSQGYSILERNFHCPFGEIDIICEKAGVLVFVEVKSRFNNNYGSPEEAVTQSKLRKINRTIDYYLIQHHQKFKPLRIDLIAIDNGKINHLENISI